MILIPYNCHLFTDVVNFIQKIDDSLDEEGEFGKNMNIIQIKSGEYVESKIRMIH
jgi:hypothetical protein